MRLVGAMWRAVFAGRKSVLWQVALAVLFVLCLVPQRADAANLSAGFAHTCALTPAGGVKCWGQNQFGQLGDGTQLDRSTPVDVVGLQSGVTSIAAGFGHTCALLGSGMVKCWGSNDFGQVGNAPQIQTTPISIQSQPVAFTRISAGWNHNCGLSVAGGAYCWGSNYDGQLGRGNGFGGIFSTPALVSTLSSGVNGLAGGRYHTCAYTNTGAALCWGRNVDGQLGSGNNTNTFAPVPVSGLGSSVTAIAAGDYHSCAIVNGGAKCWGSDAHYQVGASSNVPVQVSGLTSGVSGLSLGQALSCAWLSTGAALCWGSNGYGQAGSPNPFPDLFQDVAGATPVAGLAGGVRTLAAGGTHACAFSATGRVSCWGNAQSGQLGEGSATSRPSSPYSINGAALSVSAARAHTCALRQDGVQFCSGDNLSKELGAPVTVSTAVPVAVQSLPASTQPGSLTTGDFHTCAITAGGALNCWGSSSDGQRGDGSYDTTVIPTSVTNMASGVQQVAAGGAHTCAIKGVGTSNVYCWGDNFTGQVGNANLTTFAQPVAVAQFFYSATAISAGAAHSCALVQGSVVCWGSNYYGQLGAGGGNLSAIPVFPPISNVVQVALGAGHTCALTQGGAVYCWGFNQYGSVGTGFGTFAYGSPEAVPGLGSGALAIGAGGDTSCAVLTDHTMKCWGRNDYGQVGDGTSVDRKSPSTVVGINTAASVDVGQDHTCARTLSGEIYCWGKARDGQLGHGSFGYFDYPRPVAGDYFSPTRGSGAYLLSLLPPPASSVAAGTSVATAPGVLVVGAPQADAGGAAAGQVYVYTGAALAAPGALAAGNKSGLVGKALADVNLATLQAPLPVNGDKFGQVAISRDGATIAVGAPGANSGAGAVYIFQRPPGGWASSNAPSQTVTDPAAGTAGFGAAVVLTNAGTLLVGAPGSTILMTPGAGIVRALRRSGGTYVFDVATLISSQLQAGAGFGSAVAAEGSELVVASPNQTVNAQAGRGMVTRFREMNTGTYYAPLDSIVDAAGAVGDKFGGALALGDGTLAVGVPGRDTGAADSGAVELFESQPTGPPIASGALTDPGADAGAGLGTSVAFEGHTLLAGAPFQDVNGKPDQGAMAVYVPPEGNAPPSGTIKPTANVLNLDGDAGDHYGSALASGAGLVAAGAPNGDAQAQALRLTKALATSPTGEALAYGDDIVFRDGVESPRGELGACIAPNQPIPDVDDTGITSDQSLVTGAGVSDVDVRVRIAHTSPSDLELTLTHLPSGKSVLLYAGSSCARDNLEVVFDDQAPAGYARDQCDLPTAVSGRRLPNKWLSEFQGLPQAGPWRLTVKDLAFSDVGSLLQWCIEVR